jgi:hypothetical protein
MSGAKSGGDSTAKPTDGIPSVPLDRFWSSELTESSAQKFFSRGPNPTVSPSIFFAFFFKRKFARFELTAVSTTIAINWSNSWVLRR